MTQSWPLTDGEWSKERAHWPEAPDGGVGTVHQRSPVEVSRGFGGETWSRDQMGGLAGLSIF